MSLCQINIESQLNVGSNGDVADVSLLTLNDKKIDEYEKQDIVTNIYFEVIVPSIKLLLLSAHG